MKRVLALLMLLCCTGCYLSNEAYYQQAQRFLGSGDYDSAARLFDQLGGYADATEYALYAAGLYALQNGDIDLARSTLQQVDPFLNSSRYLIWLEAEALAAADKLEEAAELYASLGAFYDSVQKAQSMLAEIPQRDIRQARALIAAKGYQQAKVLLQPYQGNEEADALLRRCEQGIQQQAYDRASELFDEGQYRDALTAFESLGDTLDAQARLLACRSALYTQAEADYANVTLDTCEDLMHRYAELDGYLNSAQRLTQLQERFSVSLQLCALADMMPWVEYGSYPTQESGTSHPLRWRVIGISGSTAALLCSNVIDAMPVASVTDLTLDISDIPALPDAEMLASLTDLRCLATPYALAQGVEHHSDGSAWWWLADEVSPDRNAMVWYTGAILPQGVDIHTSTVGVRPVIHVDLNDTPFTQGSGTESDPFR